MSSKKIIVRVKGGLGNQLFCYAAARRMAIANGAELVIDHVSGFAHDHLYHRTYALDHFLIPARKASYLERLEPFSRYRRGLMMWASRNKPYSERRYLRQKHLDLGFDQRLLAIRLNGSIYLDGYWQGEGYFKDVEQTIREDLQIIPPKDCKNETAVEGIRGSNSVALHVRCFGALGSGCPENVSSSYYQHAVQILESKLREPYYFLFSDNPAAARSWLPLPWDRVIVVSHNKGDLAAYADLWLMSQCRHFIIANSTFSWWGAWLSPNRQKIVICPDLRPDYQTVNTWNFPGQLPGEWLKVQ